MDDKRRRYVHSLYGAPEARETLVAIDNYRNCVNDEVSFLRQENQDMRVRLSKIAEIQSRVEGLLVRDQHNLAEIERLRHNVSSQLGEIDELRAALEAERHSKLQIQAAMRTEIEALMAQLSWVSRDRDQERLQSERKMEEMRIALNNDRQHTERQMEKTLQQAQRQCSRLEQSLRNMCSEKDQNQREYTALRLRMMDQLEQLSGRVDHLSRDNVKLQSQNDILKMQLSSLTGQAQQLKQMHELATVDKLRSDQQRAQILLDLKEVEKQLSSAMMDCNVFEQRMLATEAQLARMSEFCKQHAHHIEELQAEIRKKNRLLDEYSTQLRREEERSRQDITSAAGRLMDAENCNSVLRNDNAQLLSKNTQLQIQGESKTAQIRQLLYCIEKLQERMFQLQSRCRVLQNDTVIASEKNTFLLQEREGTVVQLRSMQQKILLKDEQMRELQDLTGRKQRQLLDLRKSSGKCQHLIKKYEDEMLRMVKIFEQEKASMQQRFLQEKAKIKELYEYELRDTQDLFQRKVRVLQEGLRE